ncbi:MAG TPA: hypothetical protein VG604_01380 [Candidatus Saccharimonadales bacterium]|nr:hypothetical protein [Candidatus Saccharimonadales bacterium]
MSDPTKQPYEELGTHLKYLREQLHQTIPEVSGSVEIDDAELERIEAGLECPSEDILLLLINHFNMRDGEATQLWELAGYDAPLTEKTQIGEDGNIQKQVVMLLAIDTRTIYTDGLDINCNQAGVTLNFTQNNGSDSNSVARLGMSYDQAARVSKALQTALLHAKYMRGPKELPPADEQSTID